MIAPTDSWIKDIAKIETVFFHSGEMFFSGIHHRLQAMPVSGEWFRLV